MKKALIVILALSVCFVFAACDDNSADSIESTSIDTITQEQTDGTESSTDTDIVYGTEDTWEEDGLFSITINSATPTDERNEFYDGEEPAEVVLIDYTYKNTGWESDIMDFYVSLDSTAKLMDSEGNMLQTYPVGSLTKYSQETPVGGICNSEEAVGLKVAGGPLKIIFELYNDEGDPYKGTFIIEY